MKELSFTPETSHPNAVWLGDDGPWLCRRSYFRVANGTVWVRLSYTQEHFSGSYETWRKEKFRDLQAGKSWFRGAPDFDINPWTQEEHDALFRTSTVPPNPWGRTKTEG